MVCCAVQRGSNERESKSQRLVRASCDWGIGCERRPFAQTAEQRNEGPSAADSDASRRPPPVGASTSSGGTHSWSAPSQRLFPQTPPFTLEYFCSPLTSHSHTEAQTTVSTNRKVLPRRPLTITKCPRWAATPSSPQPSATAISTKAAPSTSGTRRSARSTSTSPHPRASEGATSTSPSRAAASASA